MMVVFSHIHASGRFDQSPTLFKKGLDHYRKISSIITVTEVDRNTRAHYLTSDGWEGVWGDKGPRDDCGITWDKNVWEKVWANTKTVSRARYVNERHVLADTTEAAFAVLQHKESGKVVLFGSLHTPHGMQDELRSHNVHSDVAIAFVKITNGYRRWARFFAKRFNVDAVALSADWNLNIRVLWARTWLLRYARAGGYKLNWTGNYPTRGTHGKEIIDATLYKGMNMKHLPKILPTQPGDDHTGYVQAFNL